MTFNETQITDIVYDAVHSFIETKISGKVYHKDCRPSDSMLEDAEIIFSTANAEQIQEGFLYINIFTKDINIGKGRLAPNRSKLKEYSSLDSTIVNMLNSHDARYRWHLDEATSIIQEPETKEHFASIKLRIKRYNN